MEKRSGDLTPTRLDNLAQADRERIAIRAAWKHLTQAQNYLKKFEPPDLRAALAMERARTSLEQAKRLLVRVGLWDKPLLDHEKRKYLNPDNLDLDQ